MSGFVAGSKQHDDGRGHLAGVDLAGLVADLAPADLERMVWSVARTQRATSQAKVLTSTAGAYSASQRWSLNLERRWLWTS